MSKQPEAQPPIGYFAFDPEGGVEFFKTMQEAEDYAREALKIYREDAQFNGEWSEDVEAIRIGIVTQHAAAVEYVDGTDYEMRPAAPSAQPEAQPAQAAPAQAAAPITPAQCETMRRRVMAAVEERPRCASRRHRADHDSAWTHHASKARGRHQGANTMTTTEKLLAPDELADKCEAWQPIETAPKDGRKLILFYKNRNGMPRVVVGGWVTDEEAAETDTDGVGLEAGWYERIDNWDDYCQVSIHQGEPTHWMPLPAAPSAQAEPAPQVERCQCGHPMPCRTTVPIGFCNAPQAEQGGAA